MAEFELSSVEKAVKGHLPKALELSRSLREHPELPDQEFESSRKMVEILKEGSAVAEKTAAATLANVRKAMRIDYFADNNLLK